MSRRRYRPLENELNNLLADTRLPVDSPIAIYYRQSTEAQIGNMSTAIQTVDMAVLLQRYGWREAQIILIDADAGVSGSKKIDEREGMSQLFRLITDGLIGAVACQDEDRLFRDVTQIQVNIFIEACKSARVLVITPTMVYDFAHPAYGGFHARQFRFKSEMAAEYITSYIKGKLHPAKRRMLMNGRWAGPPIPPGYMIDMRKELPDGSPNPNWRKFAIFEPYAEVVRAWWDLFLRYGGQLRPTARHILEHGPHYPAPGACEPPSGFKVVYRIRQHKGAWCMSRSGLKIMMTNALYLGHWMVNGSIVIRDNHPAIIDEATFMKAFHYLSEVGIDGRENPHYAPIQVYAHPMKEEEREDDWPLCAGMIWSQDVDGKWLRAGVRWSKSNGHYAYEFWSKVEDVSVWFKKAAFVDAVVCTQLVEKLEATFDFDAWEEAVSGYKAWFEQEQALKRAQLKQLETVMSNLVTSLETLKHPQMIQAAEQRFADAEAEAQRLQQDLATQEAEITQIEQIRELRDSCGDIVANWPTMTRDEQREVLHAFVDRIEGRSMENNALELVIRWKDGSASKAEVASRAGASLQWTAEEDAEIIKLFGKRASQLEIARTLPHRTWGSIQQRYRNLLPAKDRTRTWRRQVMEVTETYIDYALRVGEKSLADTEFDIHSWTNYPSLAHATWRRCASRSKTALSPSAAPPGRSPSRPTLCWSPP